MMFRTTPTMLLGSLLAFWVLPAGVEAANSINPGSLTSVYPTFENLAFDWDFSGDDNKQCQRRHSLSASGQWWMERRECRFDAFLPAQAPAP